jgi:hypothetical protein
VSDQSESVGVQVSGDVTRDELSREAPELPLRLKADTSMHHFLDVSE